MIKHFFVSGEAGAGKTRKLMDRAAETGSQLLLNPHQRALAMAVMHGARRQLELTLRRHCPTLPVKVSTIHSFALLVVNRWRRAVGISAPIVVCETPCGLAEKYGRTHATFNEIIALGSKLLESATISATLGKSYPFVIVDEFQDCVETLDFVKSLGKSSKLLLAADDFQLLREDVNGCPAVDWVLELQRSGGIECEQLPGCRRTNDPAILQAASVLRHNVKANQPTVDLYHGPGPGPLAARIVERFTGWSKTKQKITDGSCALISLSVDDSQLQKLIESFQNQLKAKVPRRVNWTFGRSRAEDRNELLTELGVDDSRNASENWVRPQVITCRRAALVSRDVVRFCRNRAIVDISNELVREFAALAAHGARAYARSSPRYQVITVHGAKNREFDHVFVFWSYKGEKWSAEQQRRLLYNAVTRARIDCTVLVLGNMARIENNPALGLVGHAKPAIDPKWAKSKKKSTKSKVK